MNDLIWYLVLSIAGAVGFFIAIFMPFLCEIKKTRLEMEKKRALRAKNPISFGLNYFFDENDRIEAVVTDIDYEAGELSIDVTLHVAGDDTILSAPNDSDLSNVRLSVRHADGIVEALSFDIANDKPVAFDGWDIVIDDVLAKTG